MLQFAPHPDPSFAGYRGHGFRASTNGDREGALATGRDWLRTPTWDGLFWAKLQAAPWVWGLGWVAAACMSLLLGHPGLKVTPGVGLDSVMGDGTKHKGQSVVFFLLRRKCGAKSLFCHRLSNQTRLPRPRAGLSL